MAPTMTPTMDVMIASVRPNSTEIRSPYSRLASTSRPLSSVPSQFTAVGGDGAGLGRL
jgi:hypothetical protein